MLRLDLRPVAAVVVVVVDAAVVLAVLLRRRVESAHFGHVAASTVLRTRRPDQAARNRVCCVRPSAPATPNGGERPGAWQRDHSSEGDQTRSLAYGRCVANLTVHA